MPMPCFDHAVLLKATARPSRDSVWTTCLRSASSSYHVEPRRLLPEAYHSQMQVANVKPNNICHGQGKEWSQHTAKKDDLLLLD
jgi:hypothetical protein